MFHDPWIFVRLLSGVVATVLFARAAWVGVKVLRFAKLGNTSEGQLALERQSELSATLIKVGAVLQLIAMFLSINVADRLTTSIRGAMCAYGVVHANHAGPWSFSLSILAALFALIYWQMLRFDQTLRGPVLQGILSKGAIVLALVSLIDLRFVYEWLGGLDFSVVASCCSSQSDTEGEAILFAAGPRLPVMMAGFFALTITLITAVVSLKKTSRFWLSVPGLLSPILLPLLWFTLALEVAPYVFETPHHRCVYCLFRPDAWYLGYLVLAAALIATSSMTGIALASLFTPKNNLPELTPFAKTRLARGIIAWGSVLLLIVLPVLRFTLVSGGGDLFR